MGFLYTLQIEPKSVKAHLAPYLIRCLVENDIHALRNVSINVTVHVPPTYTTRSMLVMNSRPSTSTKHLRENVRFDWRNHGFLGHLTSQRNSRKRTLFLLSSSNTPLNLEPRETRTVFAKPEIVFFWASAVKQPTRGLNVGEVQRGQHNLTALESYSVHVHASYSHTAFSITQTDLIAVYYAI